MSALVAVSVDLVTVWIGCRVFVVEGWLLCRRVLFVFLAVSVPCVVCWLQYVDCRVLHYMCFSTMVRVPPTSALGL